MKQAGCHLAVATSDYGSIASCCTTNRFPVFGPPLDDSQPDSTANFCINYKPGLIPSVPCFLTSAELTINQPVGAEYFLPNYFC